MYENYDIYVEGGEYYDENSNRFISVKGQKLQLKHSLLSISKWESKWHKPFLTSFKSGEKQNPEEVVDYIRCMTINQNVDPDAYYFISEQDIKGITAYIDNPMTATIVSDKHQKEGASKHRDIITSEIIYYQMIELGIPFECEKWHLNRLLMLIKVCNEKNTPGKKMSQKDILSQYSSLNKIRRARLGSRG